MIFLLAVPYCGLLEGVDKKSLKKLKGQTFLLKTHKKAFGTPHLGIWDERGNLRKNGSASKRRQNTCPARRPPHRSIYGLGDFRSELTRTSNSSTLRARISGLHEARCVGLASDSPIFAVEDEPTRTNFGLPADAGDLPQATVQIGNGTQSGRLVADAEQKASGGYFAPGPQMHNKFAVVDGRWVFTGSWNFTVTGLYGSDTNRVNNVLGGNQQHVVEVHSSELAAIYTAEFNEMWGGTNRELNPGNADFHGRKSDNTQHVLTIGGRSVEVYFSPGDDALGRLRELITDEADESVYFTIFAWSDQGLVDALKLKWEGDPDTLERHADGIRRRRCV